MIPSIGLTNDEQSSVLTLNCIQRNFDVVKIEREVDDPVYKW